MPGHLTVEERDRLAQLLLQHATQSEIARALGRSRATISRELKRNRTGDHYWAAQAQQYAEQRRRDRPLQLKMDREPIRSLVEQRLAQWWSPEQIAGRLKLEFPETSARQVSPQTIYAWIACRGEDRSHWQGFLRRRGRRPKRRENRGETASHATIADRPAIIERRGRLGDFEGDTVLGPPGSGGVVTLVDRQARYTYWPKCQANNRTAWRREFAIGSAHSTTRSVARSRSTTARSSRVARGWKRCSASRYTSPIRVVRINAARTRIPTGCYASFFPRGPTSARSVTMRCDAWKTSSTTAPAPASASELPTKFTTPNTHPAIALEIGDRRQQDWDRSTRCVCIS